MHAPASWSASIWIARRSSRAGWAEDARAYNEIATSWSAIESAAADALAPVQGALFG